MRTTSIFILVITLFGCSSPTPIEFLVLKNTSDDHKNISAGDTLKSDVLLHLKKDEEVLLCDLSTEDVYNVRGEKTINLSEITGSGIQKMHSNYFSLIRNNLRKSKQDVRYSVLGGVSRGQRPSCGYYNDESILSNSIQVFNKRDLENFHLRLEYGDEVVFECQEDECSFDLTDFRDQSMNKEIKLTITGERFTESVFLNVLSNEEATKIEKEERKLQEESFPKEAFLNLYLENKLYAKAQALLPKLDSNSELMTQLKEILK